MSDEKDLSLEATSCYGNSFEYELLEELEEIKRTLRRLGVAIDHMNRGKKKDGSDNASGEDNDNGSKENEWSAK